MKKSRTLVVALSLSVGILGINAPRPAAAPSLAPTGPEAPQVAHGVTQSLSTSTMDVSGNGPWWKKWACSTCFGVGVGLTMTTGMVGGLVLAGCAKACF